MGKRALRPTLGGIILAAALFLTPSASAATLIGDYQFQGTLASSGGGPALTKVGSGTSQFQSDNVMGSSRQVLAFGLASGVQISPAGVGTGSYSVVTTFRFDNTASYERILDTTNGTSDSGIYVSGSVLDPGYGYPFYSSSPPPYQVTGDNTRAYANNVYATTAIVVSPPSLTSIFINGALELTGTTGVTPLSDTLRFFKDDSTDESPGAVSCIRLYSGGLSAAEVAAIGASPTCGSVAAPQSKKKKCKKKKRKHRAADAKKKKCKKKKKK
jgi:hypothetical protein